MKACLGAWALCWREWVRFYRQPSRTVGAMAQPVLFWLLLGSGFRSSFAGPVGESYLEFFYVGVLMMITLFTAIYSTISIVDDRHSGFLQGVLASPLPRVGIVLGKVVGGAGLASLQCCLFIVLGFVLQYGRLVPTLTNIDWHRLPLGLLWIFMIGLNLTALGYCLAWLLESTHGFHALMSVVLMPMWALSGALFPLAEDRWLSVLMMFNPLTYGTEGLRIILTPRAELESWPDLFSCLLVSLIFGSMCLISAWGMTLRPLVRNLR